MDILFNSASAGPQPLWQDREIRFDTRPADLDIRNGEVVIQTIRPVEDTKGNNGEQGELTVTNLRLMWTSRKSRRINITIGYDCVLTITTKMAASRLKGDTQALYILTRFHGQRFEFVFTSLVNSRQHSSSALLGVVSAVHKAYDASRDYRDIKLRGAVVTDHDLVLLPQEQTYSKVNGVWNLSSEQGNLGTFFISNVRVVWYSSLANNFNVSIPYLQVRSIRVRESKFGLALVIEAFPEAGGYVLGFKIDPKETLDYVHKELSSLHSAYNKQPIFGVQCDSLSTAAAIAGGEGYGQDDGSDSDEGEAGHAGSRGPRERKGKLREQDEEQEVVVDAVDRGDILAAYYADADQQQGAERGPVFSPELGLAVEALREGTTVEQLWSVL